MTGAIRSSIYREFRPHRACAWTSFGDYWRPPDGKRERTRAFSGFVSHYLFRDRFGRPGKGNDKGKVEGLVKNGRRRFLTPVPVAASFEALNAKLEADCLSELDRSCKRTWPPSASCRLAFLNPASSGLRACHRRRKSLQLAEA